MILVIGGEGYIGTYLSGHLKSLGMNAVAYGNRNNDYNLLTSNYLSSYDVIILVAGHSSVPSCRGELKGPWNNNVRNFYNLVEKLSPSQKLIYISSSSIYGNENQKIFVEHDGSMDFINNYDLTKLALDNVAKNYIHEGRNIIGLRLGTVNGGSMVLRRDIMLNSMVYSALTEGKIFVSNTHISRPILFIGDLGRAFEAMLTKEWVSGIFNLASLNATVNEMSRTTQEQVGGEIVDGGTTSGAYDFRIDTSRFEEVYDFQFKATAPDIVSNLVDHYKNKAPKVVMRNEYFDYRG